jgi:CRP/FNR family transcriptional regulator
MKAPTGNPPRSPATPARPYGFELFDNCLTCKWRSEGFFCDLEPAALKAFDAITFTNVYPQGAVLYSEGQSPRGAFEICHGGAKLSISSADGRTLITKIVGPGEILGLSSSISGNPYKSTAETLEPTQVNFVRREDLLRFIDKHHAACANVTRALVLECEGNADHIRALELSHSAAGKLANLILSWCPPESKPTGLDFRVQMLMTHEDVSQLIGTTRETVTRLLKGFREKKLITVKGSTIIIHDRAALESLAQI